MIPFKLPMIQIRTEVEGGIDARFPPDCILGSVKTEYIYKVPQNLNFKFGDSAATI